MKADLIMTQEQVQIIQLIDGDFTPSEASDTVISIINKKINFYKLQHLSLWEKDHSISSKYLDKIISELNFKKSNLKNIIAQAKETGSKLSLEAILEIKLT